MKTKLRARAATVLSGALLLLATGAGSAAAVPSASGESGEVTAAATCYGGAVQWTQTSPELRVPSSGTYTASSRCNDINIRTTRRSGPTRTLHYAVVCFLPTWGDPYCGSPKRVPELGSGWTVLASDVLDGTKFYVVLHHSDRNVKIGGQLAF
ncbi:hypothetical protein FFT09_01925 [Saccharomonospora piscinae]|uniref:hypothetical protein n=1 Tax=Saccharomonospora piscinae TaxID=687388 RepID=UPI00110746B3|nr:hypothetical protein [Saccharomonospora piscinae]TLW94666.1 hypothetical protein FFT09_01925 [Saccharomonospora piscinae]